MKQYRPASDSIHVVSRQKGEAWGWQVVATENGGVGQSRDLGPWWPSEDHRGACRYAELMEQRVYVSPLRDESPPEAHPFPPAGRASDEAATA